MFRQKESQDIPLADAFEAAKRFGDRRGVVVLGDPGSGKTTHLKRLLLALIREGADKYGLPAYTVPVFLPLRNLQRNGAMNLPAFMDNELADPNLELSQNFGKRLRKRGRILYLLDGLDEVADAKKRKQVAKWIKRSLESTPDAYYLVTCRYAGYSSDLKLSDLFLEMHIRPLDRKQSEKFIHNWYHIVETSMATDKKAAKRRGEEYASKLVTRLKQPDFRSGRVFAMTQNPLLLTTICLVHRDQAGRLPNRRAQLYDECINVLLERWRMAKDLPVSIPADSARRILQPVAYWLHEKEGRTRATADELKAVIEPKLANVKDTTKSAAAFLASIRDESGLLTGWGNDSFGFMHLGFQEYLTALEIRRLAFENTNILKSLVDRFGESWWQEAILLLMGLRDSPLFERFMRFLVDSPNFSAHPVLVQHCMEDAIEVSEKPFLELLQRPYGKDREFWERQLLALTIMEERWPDKIDDLKGALTTHPFDQISARFDAGVKVGDFRTSKKSGVELVQIPGGSFMMGSKRGDKNETPVKKVALDSFYLSRYPITNDQYSCFLGDNPDIDEPAYWGDKRFNQERQPVVGISWDEAKAFCEWAGGMLPTEAQWEYACRAGSTGEYWSGDKETDLNKVGWYDKNSGDRLHKVGEKPPNDFGLYDMHGNVWEWCEDWYGPYKVAQRSKDGLRIHKGGSGRVIRGGGWDYDARVCRSACRLRFVPDDRSSGLGFRLAHSCD